jgi:hypothetical protein
MSGKRTSLSVLTGGVDVDVVPTPAQSGDRISHDRVDRRENEKTPGLPTVQEPAAFKAPEQTPNLNTGEPRYLRMERKELRVHPEQADELAALVRRLNRARKRRGERLTDNSLIRVAIDLLLSRSDDLVGYTEDDLLVALGLPARGPGVTE